MASPGLLASLRALDDAHLRLARRDPNAFMSYVLRDEETGLPVLQSPIHEAWQALLSLHERVLIWSHVEAGKTSQVSVGRALYELGLDPSLRVVVVGNTDAQAQKICSLAAKYITESPEYRRVFPGVRRDRSAPWTQHRLFLQRPTWAKDPSLQTCGVHGNILGARIDLLILDDLLDYENTLTAASREDLYRWYHATLEGRLTRRSRVWVVGNSWHRDDMLHWLARNAAWTARRFPVLDAAGRPTWPERWPLDRIEAKRRVLGPVEFARQLLCVARSDEESRFKLEWIQKCIARGEGRSLIYALHEVPPGFRVFTGVDLGVRTADGSDLTVLFTIAIHPDETRQVLMVESGRWSGDEIVRRIIQTHQRYHSVVLVENNAAQQFIVDFTKKLSSVPVRPYATTGRTFRSYEFGIEAMAVEMANEKWIIPSKGGALDPEVNAWVQEMLYYDPKAHAGDRLMASWFAREGSGQVKPKAQVGWVDLLRR